MKRRLRFLMPHTPLNILQGKDNLATIQDRLHEAFPVPPTSTDDDYNEASDVTTDIDDISDDEILRYLELGRNAGSIDSLSRDSITSVSDENQDQNDHNGSYHTTGSVSHESIEMLIMAQVHRPEEGDTDEILHM